jgi:hypothetical protein
MLQIYDRGSEICFNRRKTEEARESPRRHGPCDGTKVHHSSKAAAHVPLLSTKLLLFCNLSL